MREPGGLTNQAAVCSLVLYSPYAPLLTLRIHATLLCVCVGGGGGGGGGWDLEPRFLLPTPVCCLMLQAFRTWQRQAEAKALIL